MREGERWRIDLPDHGALFVVTGPSGVGKSTLVGRVMARVPGLSYSVSATTRGPRAGEMDGREYHFLTEAEFERRLAEGAFLEHATVYDRRYGTLRAPVEQALVSGRSVILDIDVKGAAQVKSAFPSCIRVFVLPPDVPALEQRLRRRGTDSDEVIARRMAQVDEQLAGAPEFDYVVINDHLETADALFESVFLAELSRVWRRRTAVQRVLSTRTRVPK